MKWPLAIATGLVGFVILLIMCQKRYYLSCHATNQSALWHDDECFILLGSQTFGESRSIATILVGGLFTGLSVAEPPQHIEDEMTIYHLHGGKMDRFTISNFSGFGDAFIYHSDLYWGRGGSPPQLFRWTGDTFVTVPETEAAVIRSSFRLDDEAIAREGWKRDYTISRGSEVPAHVVSIPLAGGTLTITCDATGPRGERRKLRLTNTTTNVSTVLQEWNETTWRPVQLSEYKKLFAE